MLENKRECDTARNFVDPSAGNVEDRAADHRIFIECTKDTDTGSRYRVTYGNTVLLESSRDPEHDAARVLLDKGITGTFETWRPGSSFAAMRFDVEVAAKWRTEEGPNKGPRRVRWRPFSKSEFK